MNKKIKNIVTVALASLIVFGFFIVCLIKPATEYSDSERRYLDQFPELSIETLLNGKFMTGFEDYTLDQFPLRDTFRSIKSFTAFYLMGQLDNNDIYVHDGYIAKLEYPMNTQSIQTAGDKFSSIYDKYFAGKDMNVYMTVVPDKNAYLHDEAGRLSMDYDKFVSLMKESAPNFEYIDIFPLLDYTDYYRTDTHWKQEEIFDVAQHIASTMGVTLDAEYEKVLATDDFKGVYMGQVSLPIDSDEMYYMTNDVLEGCTVINGEIGEQMPMYVSDKLTDRDPYEMFLGGSLSLITIENPNAETDRELIIFRDSFGSSIAPYFAEAYSKITVVDIRYIHSAMLGNFINYENQDVLFLYSTLVLNNSSTIKG